MKLLNKLNGWQRLWLLATVAGQIACVFYWTVWFYPKSGRYSLHCHTMDYTTNICKKYYPIEEVILRDLDDNAAALLACVAAYVAIYLGVKIVRWVISGFKKDN